MLQGVNFISQSTTFTRRFPITRSRCSFIFPQLCALCTHPFLQTPSSSLPFLGHTHLLRNQKKNVTIPQIIYTPKTSVKHFRSFIHCQHFIHLLSPPPPHWNLHHFSHIYVDVVFSNLQLIQNLVWHSTSLTLLLSEAVPSTTPLRGSTTSSFGKKHRRLQPIIITVGLGALFMLLLITSWKSMKKYFIIR